MLLGCEHEDCEDEEGGEEHFEEDTAGGGDACTEGCGDVEGTGDDGLDYAGRGHAGEHLGEETEACANGWDGSDEVETECHLWSWSAHLPDVLMPSG